MTDKELAALLARLESGAANYGASVTAAECQLLIALLREKAKK